MYNKVNIRVYKRGFKSTILIWNTDPLSVIERQSVNVWVKTMDDLDWWVPETAMPDLQRMGRVKDENTDTIAIIHDEMLNVDTEFMVRLSFVDQHLGGGKEAFLKVEPSNQHKVFTKPERVVLPNGKTVYAEHANVVSMDQSVINKIAQAVKDMLK